jgi:competence protein ComEA
MEESGSVIPQFIRHNILLFVIGGVGLLLFAVGLFVVLSPKDDGVVIEKTQSATSDTNAGEKLSPVAMKIVVDVEGAVVKPGIYSLPSDSREQDAIKAAGGLSPEADNGAIAKAMNMAAKLSDGMKLYLPFEGEQPVTGMGDASLQGSSTGSISINSGSESQLDSLPGVGPVTAQKIITNRPYSSLDDLVSKKAVTNSVYQKIKDLITL